MVFALLLVITGLMLSFVMAWALMPDLRKVLEMPKHQLRAQNALFDQPSEKSD